MQHSRYLRLALVLTLAWGSLASNTPARADEPHPRPIPGAVARGFDPPAVRWGAGHRGVDLAGEPGDQVMAPVAGTVTFAGAVAGRPVLVISHGQRRTTLEPVRATVSVGDTVAAGNVVGELVAGHGCSARACVHWGLREGDIYLNPLAVFGNNHVRLLPDSAATAVIARAKTRTTAAPTATIGGGRLGMPTEGRLSSGFGRRFHPIFHEWRLHAGVDISASCGTPIRAAGDGVVTHAGFDASGGWRLIIDHGGGLQSSYLHAQGYSVSSGQRVRRGDLVGTVGSTGWSTGCHVHFSTKQNGRHIDPQSTW